MNVVGKSEIGVFIGIGERIKMQVGLEKWLKIESRSTVNNTIPLHVTNYIYII